MNLTNEEFEKLKIIERSKKRTFCEFCKTFRYMRHTCTSLERTQTCRYLNKKEKKEYIHKTICKWCGLQFSEGRRLGGHMTTCKKNPNFIKRNQKISESHKGLKHSKLTKTKISESVKKYKRISKINYRDYIKIIKVSEDKSIIIKVT